MISQVVVWNEYWVKSDIIRKNPAIKPATVILQSEIAPQKYNRDAAGCGQTFAPIIPKMKESVPIREIQIRGSQKGGNIVTIILDIRNVQASNIVDNIIIGKRKSITIQRIMKQFYQKIFGSYCMNSRWIQKIAGFYYIGKIYLSILSFDNIYENWFIAVNCFFIFSNIPYIMKQSILWKTSFSAHSIWFSSDI